MDDTTPDVKISASCRPTSAGIEPDLTAVSRPELRFRESRKPPSAKTRRVRSVSTAVADKGTEKEKMAG
ncbi:hypothetical protein B296_00014107 [Ensete ventricosum]|uniref:Uncharacterized protein n=1 Tax=Ensete ventricosum TaxID=4639 RepID=A0A426ZNK8_ENSVE|nr:hypothetical protein B296_00014107 [Ensete ventricosum]